MITTRYLYGLEVGAFGVVWERNDRLGSFFSSSQEASLSGRDGKRGGSSSTSARAALVSGWAGPKY